MHLNYRDILSRISEPPQWFDEHAVPRFVAFSPEETADIYANEVALAEIACQGCGHRFRVAFSISTMDRVVAGGKLSSLADRIQDRSLHYGDPPNIDCCPAGATMNSEPKRVLEYWIRERLDWVRKTALEIDIEPDWAKVDQESNGTPVQEGRAPEAGDDGEH